MKNISKQFEVSVTSSENNEFHRAVLKLTAYYTIGVIIILTVFSSLILYLFSSEIQEYYADADGDAYEIAFETAVNSDENFHKIEESLFNIVLTSDAIILILAIFISYFLSKKTLAPIQRAYQKQERFVGDAAHELRTPLAVIKSGSEAILNKDRDKTEYKNFIKESLEEVNRLTEMSNDLLFMVRGKSPESFSKIDLSAICQKQIEKMKHYASEHSVSIEENLAPDVFILGSHGDITRLIMNVLKNAIDYNRQGGKVEITLSKQSNRATLNFKDTGIGISNHDLPRIFDRFYKAESSRVNRKMPSAGLGLAIVKDIVEAHRGTVKVKSVINQGTEFEFRFPVA